jgi:hypothetical protein
MSVENFEGIGFSRNTGAAYITRDKLKVVASAAAETSAPDQVQPQEDIISGSQWAPWGDNNLLPQEMVNDIEHCGALENSIDKIAKLGLGKGPRPFILTAAHPDGSEDLQQVDDAEIDEWLEENNFFHSSLGLYKDAIGLGNNLARFKFTKNGEKIGLCWRHDVSEMRLQRKDTTGKINTIFLSAQWQQMGTWDDNKGIKISALPYFNPANYLVNLPQSKRRNNEFGLHTCRPGWNRHYYSMPGWMSVKEWVDISKGVPKMKAALFQNNIRIKYLVIIYESYWTRTYKDWNTYAPEKKKKFIEDLWDKIDTYLAGSDNAYKSIFVNGFMDPVSQKVIQDIEIKPIDDKTKDGELLPDSSAADKQIMFSLGFNPAITGANLLTDGSSGGAGSGSDIREATLSNILMGEAERQQIAWILSIVAKVNQWQVGKKLVWRFPGLVLTTLDKGKSTETKMN